MKELMKYEISIVIVLYVIVFSLKKFLPSSSALGQYPAITFAVFIILGILSLLIFPGESIWSRTLSISYFGISVAFYINTYSLWANSLGLKVLFIVLIVADTIIVIHETHSIRKQLKSYFSLLPTSLFIGAICSFPWVEKLIG